MPKRKLSDLDPPTSTSTSTKQTSIQATRLTQLFDQGVHHLSRALKTARGFERQKLGKREQKAKKEKNEAGLERIREEIGVLKTLEYTSTAERYIFKQLLKTKRIAETGPFKEFRQIKNIAPAGPGSTAEANVTARMFKSKPVQSVLPGIMAGVKKVLRIEDNPKGEEGVKEKEKKKKEKGNEGEKKKGQSKKADEDSEGEDDDDDESVDYSHFNARLASGSGSESGESDNEEDHEEEDEASDSDTSDVNLPKSHSQQSISRSPTRSASGSPPPKKTKSSNPKANPLKPTTSTTFLPSLAMGGYFSGSESEPEDVEGAAPQRKNRMGQQARRALWEKKYGAKANHVKKAKKQEKTSRDSGWDLKRGATDGSERRPKKGRGYTPGQRTGDSNMGRKEAKPKLQDDKPLHPSWEAAKKAKEQKATTAFQGKKVVFD